MTKIDWENITNYIESVGSTDTVFPFAKAQSSVKVTNGGGQNNLIYTIGGQSGTLTPGQNVTVTGSITSMTLRASAGRQAFQVWAVEAGTEKDEPETDFASQLAQKASQSDLVLKANKTDLDTQKGRIDNLISTSNTSFYQKSTNGTTGALLVVSSGATTGQINLASVTPVATGYTPVAGDYVLLVYGVASGSAELIDGRTDANGVTYGNIGTAMRSQIGSLNKSLTTMDAMANQTTGYTNGNIGQVLTFGAQSYWIHTYISVTPGDVYQVTTSFAADLGPYVKYTDEALNIIATDFPGSGTQVDGNVKTVRVPSGVTRMYVLSYLYSLNNRIIKIETKDLQTQIGINSNIIRIGNLTPSTSNATMSNITKTGATLTLGSAVTSQGIFTSSTPINVGDFMFARIKISSNADTIIHFFTYGTSSNMDTEYNYRLKAGVQYEFYFRTFNFTTGGTLHFVIQADAANASGQVLTISDLMLIKNSYDAWYDLPTKQTLKDFTSREIIVDANGGGHFYDINRACTFAQRAFDVNNVPVTINIRNGYYLQYPTNSFPYAPIAKGANKISLIGESRDGVVIECYNTGTTQSKVIDIGGECTIENLTIKSLNDGTYNTGNDLLHNCYCIHDDTAPSVTPTKQYYTTVKNCKLYSACHSPVGAGLHNYQVKRYENCEFVSNGIISNGALYVHASTEGASAGNMGVEVVNCSCVSLDGTKAITLQNVTTTGALDFAQIPVTIQKTIGYTTGANVTDTNFKGTHQLQPQSALNNVVDWNY